MSYINKLIKHGTQVTIKDGSYMLAVDVKENCLSRFPEMEGFNGNLVTLGHDYTVIALNIPCPTGEDITKALTPQNNCILKDNTNNMIWFCSEINLRTVESLL